MEAIINFFKNLFGISTTQGDVTRATVAISEVSAPSPNLAGLVPDEDDEQGAEHISVTYGKEIRKCTGAVLVEDEDDAELKWIDTWNRERPADGWADEWGPAEPRDFDAFWHHHTEFDMLRAGDPDAAEAKLQSLGYRDVGHFFQVQLTFLKHFGEPHGEPRTPKTILDDLAWNTELVTKAALGGAQRYNAARHDEALAADPELLAPVDGVDLDTYATLAAKAGGGLEQAEFVAMLADKGLDMARWEQVNTEWVNRMSKDTSGAIAMAYSKAFGGAGAGSFGAAGQAGAAVMGIGTVEAAAGDEPIPFDRYCEIQGAMSAWSATGQDVNAMLKHTFDITAVDWSTLSMWWMAKMQSELSLFDSHSKLTEKYEAQYRGGAGGASGADDDLEF